MNGMCAACPAAENGGDDGVNSDSTGDVKSFLGSMRGGSRCRRLAPPPPAAEFCVGRRGGGLSGNSPPPSSLTSLTLATLATVAERKLAAAENDNALGDVELRDTEIRASERARYVSN